MGFSMGTENKQTNKQTYRYRRSGFRAQGAGTRQVAGWIMMLSPHVVNIAKVFWILLGFRDLALNVDFSIFSIPQLFLDSD